MLRYGAGRLAAKQPPLRREQIMRLDTRAVHRDATKKTTGLDSVYDVWIEAKDNKG